MALSFCGGLIVKYTPRVSLLSSLATIGFAFLLLAQVTLNFADPVSGLLPFAIMLLGFFCGVKYWVVPTSIVVVVIGSALSWATGASVPSDLTRTLSSVGWQGASTGFSALSDWSPLMQYFGVIFPFAVQAAVSTLMNVVSAEKAGDKYPVKEAMLIDGSTSVVGALLGTPMMTAVYIGHPGFKNMGATTSYTLMNAVAMLVFALLGLFAFINGLFPPSSLAPVIAFIGFIICTEAMDDLPSRHMVVFVAGLIPGVCSWASQNGLAAFGESQFGYIAMGGPSNMFFAMTLCSILAYCTDKNFFMAGCWAIFSAVMSAFGLLHQDTASVKDFNTPHGSYCVTNTSLLSAAAFKDPIAGSCNRGYVPCTADENVVGCGWAATTQMNFLIGYLILAGWFGIFYLLQRTNKYPGLDQIHVVEENKNIKPDGEAMVEYRNAMESLSRLEHASKDAAAVAIKQGALGDEASRPEGANLQPIESSRATGMKTMSMV
jgi:AGZA family xanthine/uracil permease-like MFS transporter